MSQDGKQFTRKSCGQCGSSDGAGDEGGSEWVADNSDGPDGGTGDTGGPCGGAEYPDDPYGIENSEGPGPGDCTGDPAGSPVSADDTGGLNEGD